MTYRVDRTAQLDNALKQGYRSLVTQLRAVGTPSRQHKGPKSDGVAKKTTAKKSSKKSTTKKAVSKKTAAKKVASKKAEPKKS